MVTDGELLALEQVRRAMDVYLDSIDLSHAARQRRNEAEIMRQRYYQSRNTQATRSHQRTRKRKLLEIGINPDEIKSLDKKTPENTT